jgi:hypothetical protein
MPKRPADAEPRRWSESDEVLALALARGHKRTAAARDAVVSPRTVRRRWADPAFRALVAEYRNRLLSDAVGRLSAVAGKAATTLGRLLDDPKPEVRLAAARAVLQNLIDVQAHADLAARVADLEAAARGQAADARRHWG